MLRLLVGGGGAREGLACLRHRSRISSDWPLLTGQSFRNRAPPSLPMAIEPLGKQPDERCEHACFDHDLIGIVSPAVCCGLDADQVIPSLDEGIALPGLDLSRRLIDAFCEKSSRPERDESEQV